MVVKKKKSKSTSKVAKRSFAKNTKPTNIGSHLGMIEKLIRPKEKEVRVKTFIVERPVYIPSNQKFPARGYDNVYDPRESRYDRGKKKQLEEEYYEEEVKPSKRNQKEEIQEENADDYSDNPEESQEEFDDQAEEAYDENSEPIEQLPEEDIENEPQTHFRSRGLFMNVWWKKALLLGAVWWIAILAFSFILFILGLVTIDLSRDWVFLLIVIEVFSLVYQKYFSGKLKI